MLLLVAAHQECLRADYAADAKYSYRYGLHRCFALYSLTLAFLQIYPL